MGFNYLKAKEPLREDNLLFITQSSGANLQYSLFKKLTDKNETCCLQRSFKLDGSTTF